MNKQAPVRVSGNMTVTTQQHYKLQHMHTYLMNCGVPYKSVSVVYHPYMEGYVCFFANSAKDLITEEMKAYMEEQEFKYVINYPYEHTT